MPSDQNFIKPAPKEEMSASIETTNEKIEQAEQKESPKIETEQTRGTEKTEVTKPSPVSIAQMKKNIKPTEIPVPADALTIEIEKVMEDGLGEVFQEMSPIKRQEFKIAGEKTARQIRELLKSAHIKIKKIFKLLLNWLKLIPGVNKFFLEQEAKIKADKIIALSRLRSRDR